MKKELYWPVGIIIFLSTFIAFLISFFIFAKTVPLNLVNEAYYEKGMTYQLQIDRLQRTQELFGQLDLQYQPRSQQIMLTFPENSPFPEIKGNIHFYRPSDSSLDFSTALDTDESGRQILDVANLKNGLWRANILWQYRKEEFSAEVTFTKQ